MGRKICKWCIFLPTIFLPRVSENTKRMVIMIPYVLIVMVLVFSVLYYKVAEMDGRHGLSWVLLSIGLGLFAHSVLGWGYKGFLAAQALLFVGMLVTNRTDRKAE